MCSVCPAALACVSLTWYPNCIPFIFQLFSAMFQDVPMSEILHLNCYFQIATFPFSHCPIIPLYYHSSLMHYTIPIVISNTCFLSNHAATDGTNYKWKLELVFSIAIWNYQRKSEAKFREKSSKSNWMYNLLNIMKNPIAVNAFFTPLQPPLKHPFAG